MAGRWPQRIVGGLRVAAMVAWTSAGLGELPRQLLPSVPPFGRPVLGVIGDSLTAGLDDRGEITWPAVLAARHRVEVRNHALAGATVASAATQVRAVAPDERLVLVEIGGNDLLGGTSPELFEVGLAKLLAAVCRPGRTVILLELPLPPGFGRFGAIQRRLAGRFGVLLVPRRVLLGVLLGEGATLDSIHLSPLGHERMAAAIWNVIEPIYEVPPSG